MRRCLTCGRLAEASRCRACYLGQQRARNARREHYRGDYPKQAAAVVAAAYADPSTRCRRCGGLARPGDRWTAGHVNDGEVGGELGPEHASCNFSAGGKLGNERKA